MSLVIFSNLAALAASHSLDHTQDGLRTAMQRLASGLRVNSAADDAAGLAIAERMTSQVRGTTQALRNTNDGISMFQTGEFALGSMIERLQHMRELAVQASNATLSGADRASLDQDLHASVLELDRTACITAFNGRHLLDGSQGTLSLQVGANAGDTLGVDLSTSVRSAQLGAIATATSADLRTLNSSGGGGGFVFAGTYTTVPIGNLDFSRPDIPFTPGYATTTSTPASNYSGASNAAVFKVDGLTISLNANYGNLAGVAGAIQGQLNAQASGAYTVSQDGSTLTITKTASASYGHVAPSISVVSGGNAAVFAGATTTAGTASSRNTHAGFSVDGHRVSLTTDFSGNAAGLVAEIQRQLNLGAPGAYRVTGNANGISFTHTADTELPVVDHFTDTGAANFSRSQAAALTLKAGDLTVQVGQGPTISILGRFADASGLAGAVQAQVAGVVANVDNQAGTLKINATETVTIGGTQAQASGALAFSPLVNPPTGSLDDAKVLTQGDASNAVLRIDAAIDTLTGRRALLGATLNRLEAVVSAQQANVAVVSAARSRITDADYASETAALSRSQVLRSAALAMLAQANAGPSRVLALLR
jgi:flagellin